MENTYTLKIYSYITNSYRREYNGLTIAQVSPSLYDKRYHATAAMIVTPRNNYNYILIKEKE